VINSQKSNSQLPNSQLPKCLGVKVAANFTQLVRGCVLGVGSSADAYGLLDVSRFSISGSAASSTSPMTPSDFAETLSIVSPGVCQSG